MSAVSRMEVRTSAPKNVEAERSIWRMARRTASESSTTESVAFSRSTGSASRRENSVSRLGMSSAITEGTEPKRSVRARM